MKKHYDQIKYLYHLTHLLKLKLTGDRYLKAIGIGSRAGGARGSPPKQKFEGGSAPPPLILG